ncbi:acetyl-CoA acetyltransferase [Sphingobium yanoikuyae]|uniref:Thiolase n=1 Tax=Sphingobium yanoikuyae TaxID=13690 RepID=A0A291N0K1_SPHYA|nr:acetyl-CoA acetyltransferase [Sphingobium yanoikuyae]ATI80735.1 thiolase [Sphingobium yanoikuyae]
MSGFPRARAAIVGAATFGIGRAAGHDSTDLAAIASVRALEDAGLTISEVDGLFFTHPFDAWGGTLLAQYLGIQPKVLENSRLGGSAFQNYVELAACLLDAGIINVALIAFGSNQASALGKLPRTMLPFPYEAPYKPLPPVSAYALVADRYRSVYGLKREQLGEVALAARRWAQLNPEAVKHDPLTMEDYLAARMVSDPLGVLDCCLVTDGAGAVVMTRSDRARDLARPAIPVLGAASVTTHHHISAMPDLLNTGVADAGSRAFAAAGLGPQDMDVVELYDAFTINTILFLEDLGFCAKGEGAAFVEGGAIAPGGCLPVNTNGGGLSCMHPGMYGLFTIIEAVRQLRGEAGERQVTDARLALAQGNGGSLSSQGVVILGHADAA